MKNYFVTWEYDGETKTTSIPASDPGHACAKILQANPEATLLRCYIQTYLAGKSNFPIVSIEYEIPSTIRVTPLPEEKMEQTCWDFPNEKHHNRKREKRTPPV